MKKIITTLFVAFVLLLSTNARAQQGLSISVKGTPLFSFLENKDDNNNPAFTNKASFNANFGVGAAYNFTRNMGVGVDVLYALQGQRYKLSGLEYNQKNDYVKIPLYFSYNTDASKRISFLGKLGPQLSILTNSKLDDNDGHTLIGNTKNAYKSYTFGGMVSAGAQYRFNNSLYLTAALRYDYDFTNAEDHQNTDYASGRPYTHNMTAGLEIGLKYMLK